jgi:hypothetical protein
MDPGSRKSLLWCRAVGAVFLVLALALVGAPAAAADPLAGTVEKAAADTGSAVQKVDQADAQLTPTASKAAAAPQAPVAQATVPRAAQTAPSAPVHAAGSVAAAPATVVGHASVPPAASAPAVKVPAVPVTQVARTAAGALAPVTHAASNAAAVTQPAAKITTQVNHTAAAVTAPLSKTLGAATTQATAHPGIPAPVSGAIAHARSLAAGGVLSRGSGGGPMGTGSTGGPFAGAGPSAPAPSLGGPATTDLTGAKAADKGHPTGGVLALAESAPGSRSSWLAGLAPISSLPLLLSGLQTSHKGGRGGSQGSALPSTPFPAPGPLGGVSPASAAALGFGFLMFLGLAGLLVLAAPFAARWLRLAGRSLGASAFVLVPERPG